jgi:hypothetical protein
VPQKRDPRTVEARQALNQHMNRHHGGDTGASGTLGDRLSYHDDAHWDAAQGGTPYDHTHGPLEDGETEFSLAHRYLAEGTRQALTTNGSE